MSAEDLRITTITDDVARAFIYQERSGRAAGLGEQQSERRDLLVLAPWGLSVSSLTHITSFSSLCILISMILRRLVDSIYQFMKHFARSSYSSQ